MVIAIGVKVPLVTILDKLRLTEALMPTIVMKIFGTVTHAKIEVTVHHGKNNILIGISLSHLEKELVLTTIICKMKILPKTELYALDVLW